MKINCTNNTQDAEHLMVDGNIVYCKDCNQARQDLIDIVATTELEEEICYLLKLHNAKMKCRDLILLEKEK